MREGELAAAGPEAACKMGRQIHPAEGDTARQECAASALPGLGIQPGDKVSFMGDTLIEHEWAHLARVEIVSEIPLRDIQTFWAATEAEKRQAFEELAGTGAKALIARDVPTTAAPGQWTEIGTTDYYIHYLEGPVGATEAAP